ncbi:error-prone DNA polymerase [Mucilaginibacter ginsenosidivorax]|uniref:Error-prone DNA polymerase n=1 Tax=Mucilaginibacter ginsenosidivorax TaxID=862126 RepID=A0A5B8VUZ4_9SPHI|nr:error-prone DNA polymerase [Mucilaginibacter ginsenosidivorax]QEC74712.1 DNA polymerase III subunit alpha [Mucilaginibacter ginsenosidivorax]
MSYVELQVTSNFSFRRGGSHPEELVDQAADLGYDAIGLTDRNTFAGLVRAYVVAKDRNIKLIPGVRLDLLDGPSLLAYPTNKEAYGSLSALLTLGNLRAEKEKCYISKSDVYHHAEGSIFIIIPPDKITPDFEFELVFTHHVKDYKTHLSNLYMAATRYYTGDDAKRLFLLAELGVPLVATNDVHYHHPNRRELQDVLTCIREKCNIFNAGYKLHQNAERHLKEKKEMERLFRNYPEAISNARKIADACTFDLKSLKYKYPSELTTDGRTPMEQLTYLTWKGANEFYKNTIPTKVKKAIEDELEIIAELDVPDYFLTVEDYVTWARNQNILCQGRGSAANSAVCFVLGITSVAPDKSNLLFARFLSKERNEPPDIDVDFEYERREEVMQYVYNRFGRDRAAVLPTVFMLHYKGAVNDVSRAMGLSVDTTKMLSDAYGDLSDEEITAAELKKLGLNFQDPHLLKVIELTGLLIGFPRQLGQHTGGFVITDGKLSDLCPIFHARMKDRTNIEWNKDDIDALGFMKVDILSLGMLTCIRKAFDLVLKHYGRALTLANIPQDDPKVYEMITAADTLGVFQIESRAQMSMLPRLRPTCFYDLVIEVAIVRPGPIQGDMVHPYIRRRNGEEAVDYPSDEIRSILERTLGVPLFQEQAMELAIVAAGFTPGEADLLRRTMATFKFNGMVSKFEHKLINGMTSRGYSEEYARRIFKQLEGFGSYGFPESHAASFALLVYVSCWLKFYYPEVFCAALLNSQPMGFYQPAQIVRNAREHGVIILPIDVNRSQWDNILEAKQGRYFAMRLGLREIDGIKQAEIDKLIAGRGQRPNQTYTQPHQLCDAGVSIATMERLANADTFRSMDLDRRNALWEVAALHDRPVQLMQGQPSESLQEPEPNLPELRLSEHVVQDYATTGLSIKGHPLTFIRHQLEMLHIKTAKDANQTEDKKLIKTAGLILIRQRPGTAKGVCFITLEDETGTTNLVVFPKLFDQYRKEILHAKLLMVEGVVEQTQVTHIIVRRVFDITKLLANLTEIKNDHQPVLTLSRADEKSSPFIPMEKPLKSTDSESANYLHKGRNFK